MESLTVDKINHLSNEQQAEAIADSLSAISNEYKELRYEDFDFPNIPKGSFPQFSQGQIQRFLENIKTKKSTVLGDIPAKVIKECAQYICIPVTNLINKSIAAGKWADIYKKNKNYNTNPKGVPHGYY